MPTNGVDPVAYRPMVVISSPLRRGVAPAHEIGAAAHVRVVIRETKQPTSETRSVFTKATRSLGDPYSDVRWPAGHVDREVEGVVASGRHADNVSAQSARAHIAELTVGQDFSERRLALSGRVG